VSKKKKIGLIILLLPLVVIEGYLCMAFLPMRWQLALQRFLPESHDYTDITHPDLAREIDTFLATHTTVKVAFYTLLAFLLVINSLYIFWILQSLRGRSLLNARLDATGERN
jgi:hypothetical protein